jgi:aconitate hydratase
LLEYLAELGFNIVGYGLHDVHREQRATAGAGLEHRQGKEPDRRVGAQRQPNFEGRIQSQVRANYLASPPLVVAYALAGRMQIDLTAEPLGEDSSGAPVYLKDIWPTEREIQATMLSAVKSEMFRTKYATVFDGDERLAIAAEPDWRTFRVGRALHLHPQSAVPRGYEHRADASVRHRVCARARRARRQRHDRSHLARRIDSQRTVPPGNT